MKFIHWKDLYTNKVSKGLYSEKYLKHSVGLSRSAHLTFGFAPLITRHISLKCLLISIMERCGSSSQFES